MTTSLVRPVPTVSTISTGRAPLRLRLAEGRASGPLDGAWWPQSRDLRVEGADLVDHFPQDVGRVGRLLFSRPDWDAVAGAPALHRIRVGRGSVKVGSFPSDDTRVMVATMQSGQRLRLLVVPSDTDPALAAEVMEQAADAENTGSAAELLGVEGPDQSHIGSDVWDDDEGATH